MRQLRGSQNAQVETFAYLRGGCSYKPFIRSVVRACHGLETPPACDEEAVHLFVRVFRFTEQHKLARHNKLVKWDEDSSNQTLTLTAFQRLCARSPGIRVPAWNQQQFHRQRKTGPNLCQ